MEHFKGSRPQQPLTSATPTHMLCHLRGQGEDVCRGLLHLRLHRSHPLPRGNRVRDPASVHFPSAASLAVLGRLSTGTAFRAAP